MVYSLSTAAVGSLYQTHTMVSRCDIFHSGKRVYTLNITDGDVSAEANRPVMRNLACTLSDPAGILTGNDLGDLLSPYDAEIAAFRGVVYDGITEMAPLGVFQMTDKDVVGDGSISITGQDRSIIYQGQMTGSLAIGGGTPVEAAIVKLLQTRNRGMTMYTWKTGHICGPLLYDPSIDVWAEAQKLAQSVGGQLYHTRTGALMFSPALPTSERAVRRFAYGDGMLLTVKRKEDVDTIRNVVVAQSAKLANGSVITAVASDNNPRSPTYAGGRYGIRSTTITNPHISTMVQAQQVAAAELVRQLGRSETVTATAVVDPRLDPQDICTLDVPTRGLVERGMALTAVTIPFAADAEMSMSFQKSLLAADGQVLPPQEVTNS